VRASVRAMMLPAHFHAEPTRGAGAGCVASDAHDVRRCVRLGRVWAGVEEACALASTTGAGRAFRHASRGVLASCGAISLNMSWATRHGGAAHVFGELGSQLGAFLMFAPGSFVPGLACVIFRSFVLGPRQTPQ
jgi:hypothetical protein